MFVLKTALADDSNGFVYPQVEHMGSHYAWDAPDSVLNARSAFAAGRSPNLRSFHLDAATVFTDVVTQGYIETPGLLVSTRLRDLLGQFRVQPNRPWPADVVLNREHRDYAWLDFTQPAESAIDWAASVFEIRRDDGTAAVARFDSALQLAETARKLVDTLTGRLRPRQLKFLAGTQPLDLFMLSLTARVVLASDVLADRLSRERMTGFQLIPCDP